VIVLIAYHLADYYHILRGPSSKQSCLANLKQLEGAKISWALEVGKTNLNEIPTDSDLFGMTAFIRNKPECPEGGTYTIGPIAERPQCSVPFHSLEAGDVYVCDESGEPVNEAVIRVMGVPGYQTPARTGTNGYTGVNCWVKGATRLRISKTAYVLAEVSLTNRWPFRIVLRRSTRK
jgi:hypothetical protein